MYKLLSVDNNPKVMKGNKLQDKYWSVILHLAPSNLADGKRTVCPYSKIAKCEEPCLNTAGLGGVYPSIQKARIRKTLLYLNEYEVFMEQLIDDINRFIRACERKDRKPCIRLNGTSDIQWEHQLYEGKTVFEMFPSVQFYDYTKIPTRKIEGIDNYHLTWSYSEATKKYAKLFDAVPNNKAVVFRKTLPSFFKGLKVIDGDTHDMRFLDEDNVVVGLKAKGKAKKDYSGFVIDNEKIETRTMICL